MDSPRLASSVRRSRGSPSSSGRREIPSPSPADKIMRYIVPIQLILMHLQYIGLLNQLDVGWPDSMRSGYSKMEVLNINVREIVGYVEIPTLDFRGMFTIVSVLAPIAITLCTLLIFEFVVNIVLYFMLVFGVVVFIAGMLSRFIQSAEVEQASLGSQQANIIVGATLTGVGLIGMLIYKLATMKFGKLEHIRDEEEKYFKAGHRMRSFRHCVSSCCLVFCGLVLTSVIDFGAGDLLAATSINIWLYFGICFLALGGLNTIYFLAILTQCGREKERALANFFSNNGLLLIFQLIGSTFIPVLSNAIQLEMCTEYQCPKAHKFNPFSYRPLGSYDTSTARYCDYCHFLNSKCSADNVTDLCQPYSGLQVWAYPETSCEDQSATIFRIAGFIAIFSYGLFIPLIYWKVAHYLKDAVMKKTDYPGKNDESISIQWRRIIKFVQPVAGTLYSPFARSMWYFMLINLLQRVLVMIALLVIAPYSNGAAVLMFAVYAGYAFIVYWRSPYLRVIDQGLAMGLSAANVFNGAAAIYVWQKGYGEDPDNLWFAFIAANVGLPFIFLFYAYKRRRPALTPIALSKEERKEHLKYATDFNEKTGKTYLTHFFMFMGVFFIIAFGACLLGMLQQSEIPYRISTEALYQTKARLLGGYDTWDEMTDRCCCLQTEHPTNSFEIGERWICRNGVTIERGRRTFDGDDGTPLRAVCGEKPIDSRCSIKQDSNGVPYLYCPTEVKVLYVPGTVSEVAYKYYF